MSVSLVVTVIGPDRPGLVESISEAVAAHEGNWLESRMSRLAGKFAGILRVDVAEPRSSDLTSALLALESQGLKTVVEQSAVGDDVAAARGLRLEIVGSDQPGIVHDISQALARRSVNVEELVTERTDAPMAGSSLFKAWASLRAPHDLSVDDLREALEQLAHDLMVDVTLDES
ncbi:MAG: glycine cleavage system protein R [bacterium]|nr:glycine cleavage system protein R [bacterium]